MAAEELAYVLINPHTISKSRTGGVITRLLTRTGLDLAAARMFAPSQALVDEYAGSIVTEKNPKRRRIQELIREYVLTNYAPHPKTGRRRRVMMLVFKGEDAALRLRETAGSAGPVRGVTGETIRATFGDYITDAAGRVRYFEPAVLVAPNATQAEAKLKIWAKYSDTDGGVLKDVVTYDKGRQPKTTLVLLKPDNFRFPSGRPGNIVDMLSRTGLFIIAIKVHRMSLAQAREFYGPVREVLRTKMVEMAGPAARHILAEQFDTELPTKLEPTLGKTLAPYLAEQRFNSLIQFMTGRSPCDTSKQETDAPGLEKIVAVVYQGVDAVAKIRNVLGPTDPSKAPPGTIRRELGESIMINAAHASDSVANAKREMKIIDIKENGLRKLVEEFYHCKV